MTTYYVAPASLGGSNSNNGLSTAAPFLTIAHAGGAMASGDTLNVRSDGIATFDETLTDPFPSGGGSFATATIIQGYPGDPMPVIRSAVGAISTWSFDNTNYLIITKLLFDGVNCTGTQGGANIKITIVNVTTFSHHIRVTHCILKNMPAGSGVLITKGSQNTAGVTDSNEVSFCEIHNEGDTTHHHDIYCESSNNLFHDNTLGSTSGYCIQIYFSSAVAGDLKSCTNNLVYNNSMTNANDGGITVSFGDNNQVYNNLIFGCAIAGGSNGGIVIDRGATNTLVYNNTVYNNSGTIAGINTQADSPGAPSGTLFKNNITYNNAGGDYHDVAGANSTTNNNLCGDTSLPVGNGNVRSSNPQFVSAGTNDFHITSSSPCINAGVSTAPTVTVDYDGVSRPQGNAYDIGAYEFRSQGGTFRIPVHS